MALIKPELTEGDGGMRKEKYQKTNNPVNRNSRSVRAAKRLKVGDLRSLTTAICLCCVILKQKLCVHQ